MNRARLPRTVRAAAVMLAALGLAACNLPGPASPSVDLAGTAVRQTVDAQFTQAAAHPSATPVMPTGAPPTAANTPTFTLPPSLTPTSTPTPIPCNRAAFVTDVTVPDGADYHPFDLFTKTWRLRNTGSCTWTSAYSLVFDHGDHMLGPEAQSLTGSSVPPGGTLDVSVNLEAPGTPGGYKGYWKLRDPGGVLFGVGASGATAIWVEIEVLAPPPTGPLFDVVFDNTHTCSSTLTYAAFRVSNTGSVGFESAGVNIKDITVGGSTLYNGTNNQAFVGTPSGCPPGNSSMGPGSVYFIAVSIGASPPHGHIARLTLKLCSADGLGGDCVSKTLDFVVP